MKMNLPPIAWEREGAHTIFLNKTDHLDVKPSPRPLLGSPQGHAARSHQHQQWHHRSEGTLALGQADFIPFRPM